MPLCYYTHLIPQCTNLKKVLHQPLVVIIPFNLATHLTDCVHGGHSGPIPVHLLFCHSDRVLVIQTLILRVQLLLTKVCRSFLALGNIYFSCILLQHFWSKPEDHFLNAAFDHYCDDHLIKATSCLSSTGAPPSQHNSYSPQDPEKTSWSLDFKTYENLFRNCSSLIKILRILALKSFMNSLLSETFETSADISLSKVTVLLQPKAMEKLRKFKPTKEDLKTAFYQLVRSSQTHFKPSSKYFLPIVLTN